MIRKLSLICLLFSIVVNFSSATLTLSNGKVYPSVSLGFPRGQPDPNETYNGSIILADPFDACSPLNNNVNGKIVITQSSKCFPSVKGRNAQNAGALAFITFSFSGSFGSTKYFQSSENEDDVIIPGFEIATSFQPEIIQTLTIDPNITASIFADENKRDKVLSSPYWIVFSIVNGLVNLGVSVLCSYRLLHYILNRHMTTAAITHVLISIGCVARLVDMIDFNGYYNLLHYIERTFLVACSLVLTINAAVAIGFFWLDLFDRERLETRVSFLKRFKVHTFIALIVISAISLTISILTSALINAAIIGLIGISIYAIFTLLIFVFFIYCCHMIRKYLNTQLENENGKISKAMKKLFVLGVCQCIGLGLYFIISATLAIPNGSDPVIGAINSSLLVYVATFISIVQVLMFSNPKRQFPCLRKKDETNDDDGPTTKVTFSKEEYELPSNNVDSNHNSNYPSANEGNLSLKVEANSS